MASKRMGYTPASPASETLVREHAPLVKRIALHLAGRLPDSVQVEDLIQAGMLGLLEAAQRFDPGQGAAFTTYAGIRIRGAMMDEVRRGDWVPRSVYRESRQISTAMRAVENRLGRAAEPLEVATELGMTLADYHKALQDAAGGRLYSIDELDEDMSHHADPESRSPEERTEGEQFQRHLAEEIRRLPEKEQLVLALYYDEELNLKEIGAVLGVSESRVSQLHSQATLRLRSRLGSAPGSLDERQKTG